MFELTFLGTAASTPSAERGLPALLVGAGRERYLIDCGEGTQRQMLRARTGFRRLRRVLLTHADLDHVLGLAGLVASFELFGIDGGLEICGSAETVGFVERYLASLWPRGQMPAPVRFVAFVPGAVAATRTHRISCFPVRHRATASLGYRFETVPRRHLQPAGLTELGVPAGPARMQLARGEAALLADGRRIEPAAVQGPLASGASLAVIGDAEEADSLVDCVRGVDALVSEATFLDADAALAASRGHLTAGAAARLAVAAGVGSLYLTHLSNRYEPAAIAAEARRFFANVAVMSDFARVTVKAAPRG
jgi:ribonuclease Z